MHTLYFNATILIICMHCLLEFCYYFQFCCLQTLLLLMCLCVCPPLHLKSAISISGDCHLSAAVRPVIERHPPGYLFVFGDGHPPPPKRPFTGIIEPWWNIINLQLRLCTSLNSLRDWHNRVTGRQWYRHAKVVLTSAAHVVFTGQFIHAHSHQMISDCACLPWRGTFLLRGISGCC